MAQLSQTLPGNTTAQNDALSAANAIINIFDRARMGTREEVAKVIAEGRALARKAMFGGINVDDPKDVYPDLGKVHFSSYTPHSCDAINHYPRFSTVEALTD